MLARCWLVGLVILCHGLVRQAKAQAPTAMIESTIQALRAQGYPKALEMAQAFVQAAPRDSWARTLRGAPISGLGQNKGNLLKQKECEKVVSHYEHAQSSIAKNPSALMQLGVCLVNTHKLEETGPVSERLLTLQPDDWRKRYNLGLIQYLTQQYRASIQTLQPLVNGSAPEEEALNLYDTVSKRWLKKGAHGTTPLRLPGGSAAVIVLAPGGGVAIRENGQLRVNGRVIDYQAN